MFQFYYKVTESLLNLTKKEFVEEAAYSRGSQVRADDEQSQDFEHSSDGCQS